MDEKLKGYKEALNYPGGIIIKPTADNNIFYIHLTVNDKVKLKPEQSLKDLAILLTKECGELFKVQGNPTYICTDDLNIMNVETLLEKFQGIGLSVSTIAYDIIKNATLKQNQQFPSTNEPKGERSEMHTQRIRPNRDNSLT